jgi:hypothetical protein
MTTYDDIYEALRDTVKHLGGAKIVGHAMRPEKTIDQAQGWLLDCLNPSRPEKLDPEQVIWLLRMAHDSGHHEAKIFIDSATGYQSGAPLTPENEQADLQRKAIEAAQQVNKLFAQMAKAGVKIYD